MLSRCRRSIARRAGRRRWPGHRHARRRPGARRPTSCSSPSAAGPSTATLGLETVGLEPGRYVEVDDQLRAVGVEAAGCTPSATATDAPCSPTWASTRPASRADVILGKRRARASPTTASFPASRSPTRRSCAVGLHRGTRPASRASTSARSRYATGDVAGASRARRRRSRARASSSSTRPADVIVGATFIGPGRPGAAALGHRSPSPARSRSTGSGTPCRRSRPSARCGCGCSRRTGCRPPAVAMRQAA